MTEQFQDCCVFSPIGICDSQYRFFNVTLHMNSDILYEPARYIYVFIVSFAVRLGICYCSCPASFSYDINPSGIGRYSSKRDYFTFLILSL